MIHNSKDGIFSMVLGQSCDQVHCYLLKGEHIFLGCNLIQRDFSFISNVFVLLAYCTSFDVVSYSLAHALPIVLLFSFVDDLSHPGCPADMWSCMRIMICLFLSLERSSDVVAIFINLCGRSTVTP